MDEEFLVVQEAPVEEPKDLVAALRGRRTEDRIEFVRRLRPKCVMEIDPLDTNKVPTPRYSTHRNLLIILLTTRDPQRMVVGRIIQTLHWDVIHVSSILRWAKEMGYVEALGRRHNMYAITQKGRDLARGLHARA